MIVDVFVMELNSQMTMSVPVECDNIESFETEEAIDLLSDTICGDREYAKFVWCCIERLPHRSFADECSIAGRYFNNRITEYSKVV